MLLDPQTTPDRILWLCTDPEVSWYERDAVERRESFEGWVWGLFEDEGSLAWYRRLRRERRLWC